MTLPPMDVAGRVERLRGSLEGAGCDALLVTHLTNIRYLTRVHRLGGPAARAARCT